MDEMAKSAGRPSVVATVVAYVVIGLLVTTVTKAIFKQRLTVAVVAGLLAFALHQNLDAPVARKLSELGL